MSRTGAHILLVDDHPKALEVFELRLRGIGHRVSIANNGEVAIGIVERATEARRVGARRRDAAGRIAEPAAELRLDRRGQEGQRERSEDEGHDPHGPSTPTPNASSIASTSGVSRLGVASNASRTTRAGSSWKKT